MSEQMVEVAAAVMLRCRSGGRVRAETPFTDIEFLLACRPAGKVYAGYWEFPGGKVEAGESVRAALVRELQEELGITVTEASPWLHKTFTYPHATVHLNFWRVLDWEGEIGEQAPLEHSAVDWLPLVEALSVEARVAPVLPANGPILKSLALPMYHLITQAGMRGQTAEAARLLAWIESHPGERACVVVREPDMPWAEQAAWVEQLSSLIRPAGLDLLVSVRTVGQLSAVAAWPIQGVHLSGAAWAALTTRPDFPWVGASCHSPAELRSVAVLGLDYAWLSPVLPTASHPDQPALGWHGLRESLQDQGVPVLALGGMDEGHLASAWSAGAHGVAMLRAW